MLITKVKVGQVTNLSEARYCAGMGVDFLSFPISSVDPKTYKEITSWVAGPKFGIEVNSSNVSSAQEYTADFFEININLIDILSDRGNLVISLEARDWSIKKTSLLLSKGKILFIELKISSLDEFTLGVINDITEDFKILLEPSENINLDEVLKLHIDGLSFDGNAETKPGLKEYPLSEILEKLDVES